MEDTYLVYSKTMTDNLPITSTDISPAPCMNPAETTVTDCTTTNGYVIDPRYSQADFSISEYDLQIASGVLQIL